MSLNNETRRDAYVIEEYEDDEYFYHRNIQAMNDGDFLRRVYFCNKLQNEENQNTYFVL